MAISAPTQIGHPQGDAPTGDFVLPKTRFCLALHEFSCRATREKLQKDFLKIVERF